MGVYFWIGCVPLLNRIFFHAIFIYYVTFIHIIHLIEFVTQGQKSMTLTVMGTIRYDTTKPKTDCFTQTFMMTTQPSATGGLSWKIARDCFRTIE